MTEKKHQPRAATILLVEDDPADQNMIRRFLKDSQIKNELHTVRDGEQALHYLYRRGKYKDPADSPRPLLILLDLNLPRVNGFEVLNQIKQDETLKDIPVVVMTTSGEQSDIWQSYNLGANSYIVKPVELERFVEVVQSLQQYWLQVVVLPSYSEDA